MRTAFVRAVTEAAEHDERVFLITADTGFHVLDDFRKRFPGRFLNAGIAEAAMIGVAAGLALEGFLVFAYGIAPFVTLRCLEHIRVDLCLHGLPVRVVGVGAGLTYGPEGATHHATDDVGALSALPGMTVLCPGDPVETEFLVRASLSWPGPVYLRLGKSGEPVVHERPVAAVIGRGIRLRAGKSVAVLGSGTALAVAAKAVERLVGRGLEPELWSMHTLKPFDAEAIEDVASRCTLLVTVEEHGPFGGLASRVAEVIAQRGLSTRLLMCATGDEFVSFAAGRDALRGRYGLTPETIATRVMAALDRGKV